MPISLPDTLIRGSNPYVTQDIDVRGGYRTVASIAERDAIPLPARKRNMLVNVIGEGWFTLPTTVLTNAGWAEHVTTQVRKTFTLTYAEPLAPSGQLDFEVPTGFTADVLRLFVNLPNLTVECHSTAERTDANPYRFISYVGHLEDDGSTLMDDDTVRLGRRFARVANLETEPVPQTYWRIINNSETAVTPTVTVVHFRTE